MVSESAPFPTSPQRCARACRPAPSYAVYRPLIAYRVLRVPKSVAVSATRYGLVSMPISSTGAPRSISSTFARFGRNTFNGGAGRHHDGAACQERSNLALERPLVFAWPLSGVYQPVFSKSPPTGAGVSVGRIGTARDMCAICVHVTHRATPRKTVGAQRVYVKFRVDKLETFVCFGPWGKSLYGIKMPHFPQEFRGAGDGRDRLFKRGLVSPACAQVTCARALVV